MRDMHNNDISVLMLISSGGYGRHQWAPRTASFPRIIDRRASMTVEFRSSGPAPARRVADITDHPGDPRSGRDGLDSHPRYRLPTPIPSGTEFAGPEAPR